MPLIITSWEEGPKEYKTIVGQNEQSIFIYPEWLPLQRERQTELHSVVTSCFSLGKGKKNKWLHSYIFVPIYINISFSFKTTDSLEIEMLSTLIYNVNFCSYTLYSYFYLITITCLIFVFYLKKKKKKKTQPYLLYFMLLTPIF